MKKFEDIFVSSHTRRCFLQGVMKTGSALLLADGMKILAADQKVRETPARFFKVLHDKTIQCGLCFRQCILEPGDSGECDIRLNRDGKMITLAYGDLGAMNIDPIEKKPLFHYLPGTMAFSIATIGCNIDCKFCQNWQIAHARPGQLQSSFMTPEEVAKESTRYRCPTIAYTYSEPTVWSEFVIDCTDAGLKQGIGSVVISNGTWHPDVLDELLKRVKAIKVDLKSIEPEYYRKVCDADLRPVLANIERIRKSGVWLELVNLVVTTLNDSDANFKKLALWVKENVGVDVPVHFTRFHPMYKLKNLAPTPVQALDHAYDIARAEGLKYVYVGNVPGHRGQNTLCPKCGVPVIERKGYRIQSSGIQDGKCCQCGVPIPGVWS
ncbi:AmmeMemoRadiSam system radical SAM enzyme [bacterium]|nr:AmmeMemoRadiSam system radical SAM enzyme [candidate division CSSED10-310 bacterium]